MTNMITRLLSLLKSFSHASNFSSNGFSERAFSLKRGRFEPLEERCLLAVDVAAFAPALADDSNLVVARASEAPDVESAPAIDLGDLTSNATLDDDYVITRVLDSSTQEDDEDVLAPAFEIDGVPYYSANEIIARQIVFSSADITPNDNLANGTPIILGEGNAADSDIPSAKFCVPAVAIRKRGKLKLYRRFQAVLRPSARTSRIHCRKVVAAAGRIILWRTPTI